MQIIKKGIALFLLLVFSALLLPESLYHHHNQTSIVPHIESVNYANGVIIASDAEICFICHKVLPHFYYLIPFLFLSFGVFFLLLYPSNFNTYPHLYSQLIQLRGPPIKLI